MTLPSPPLPSALITLLPSARLGFTTQAQLRETFEKCFYTDSLMTLYEWQRVLRSLMLSNTVSIMSGWLTLINEQEEQLKRLLREIQGVLPQRQRRQI